jgi:hypothetical protein
MKVGLRGLFYPAILGRVMITGESFRNWAPSFLCPFFKIWKGDIRKEVPWKC